MRPDHLWSQPPKHEEPFSTPRSWHMLSDALHSYGDDIDRRLAGVLAYGCLSPQHAGQFKAFVKQVRSKYMLSAIMKGDVAWPRAGRPRRALLPGAVFPRPADQRAARRADGHERRAQGVGPPGEGAAQGLAAISLEIAQMVVATRRTARGCPAGSWSRWCATCRAWWRRRWPRNRTSAQRSATSPPRISTSAATCAATPLAPLLAHATRRERQPLPERTAGPS